MQATELSERIEVIKRTLERSSGYGYTTGWGALFFGAISLIPSIHFYRTGLLLTEPSQWLIFCTSWLITFLVALFGLGFGIWLTARRHQMPFLSETVKAIGFVLSPSLLVAMVLTALFYQIDQFSLAPGAWFICYGCGFLSASIFLNVGMKLFGLIYLLYGTAYLLYFHSDPHLMMMIGFGALHLLLGTVLLVTGGRTKEEA